MTIRCEEFVDNRKKDTRGRGKIYKRNNTVLTSICVSLKVDSISRLKAFPKKKIKNKIK